MSSPLFVGIDVGSASVRTGFLDAKGRHPAFAVRTIWQFHPRPLLVEQSSADLVGPGQIVAARPESAAFDEAKRTSHLPPCQNMEPCRSAMHAWQ